MKIIRGNGGFCFGVKNAVETALSHKGEDISVLGELVHNAIVKSKLESNGILSVDFPENVKTEKVIIRSHGEPKAVIDELKKRGIGIIDATCPFVGKIHKIVEQNFKNRKKIIILGSATHPEVVGINGWCDNSAQIISDVSQINSLDYNSDYCLVSQTTFSLEKYNEIVENIKKLPIKSVEFFNTICYTTKERQLETEKIAKRSDAVFVLGSQYSSNTQKLVAICRQFCQRVFLIESNQDIDLSKIKESDTLGIVAGASTPKELIEEVCIIMSEEFKDAKVELESETAAEVEAAEDIGDKIVATNELKSEEVQAVTEPTTMEEAMSMRSGKLQNYRAGKIIKAKVFKADDKGIIVTIGGKKDGLVSKEEAVLDGEYNPDNFPKDSEIEVMIIENSSSDKTYIALSKKEVDKIREGDKKAEEMIKGGVFDLKCDQVVKGGLLGKLGSYTVFVPASHIRSGFVKNLEEYIGKTLHVKVLPEKESKEGEEVKKHSSKRIVASQRLVLEEEKKEKEDSFWDNMHVNDIVVGKVKRFSDFGAFINVNGFDCLARPMDISWVRGQKAEDVLKLNEKYDFVVISLDRNKGKSGQVGLSYKLLQDKPFQAALKKYMVGDVVTTTVARITNFGIFVPLVPGFDGLIHVSQLAHNFVKSPEEAFKVGDEISAKIISIDEDKEKINLSIKDILPAPEPVFEVEEVKADSDVKDVKKSVKADKQDGDAKKPVRRERKLRDVNADDGELHEWKTDKSVTTLGDLFGSLDFKFGNEEETDKKAAKSKKKADEE